MIRLLLVAVVLGSGFLGACAHPLEKVMDEHREARVAASYANQPITAGSGDGLGHIIGDSAGNRLTMSGRP